MTVSFGKPRKAQTTPAANVLSRTTSEHHHTETRMQSSICGSPKARRRGPGWAAEAKSQREMRAARAGQHTRSRSGRQPPPAARRPPGQEQRPRLLGRVQGPLRAPEPGAAGERGASALKHGAPPRPRPAPREADGDPQEEAKEGPYPAGSGRGARPGLHPRPGGAGRPGRGGSSQALALRLGGCEPCPARPGRKPRRPWGGAGAWRGGKGRGQRSGARARLPWAELPRAWRRSFLLASLPGRPYYVQSPVSA